VAKLQAPINILKWQVTIFGESAGGMSVIYQVLMLSNFFVTGEEAKWPAVNITNILQAAFLYDSFFVQLLCSYNLGL
jgi:hypothetical protein